MTFIQPHKNNSPLNRVLILLVCVVVVGTFWLIITYNKVVSLNHEISDTKQNINKIQAESAELKDRTFALFDGNYLQSFAKDRNLVQDKTPQYFEVHSQWSFASHF